VLHVFRKAEFSTDSVENSVENRLLSDANFCSMGTFSALHTYCSNSVNIASLNISALTGRKRDFIGFFGSFSIQDFSLTAVLCKTY
jgi:hypothetical protein